MQRTRLALWALWTGSMLLAGCGGGDPSGDGSPAISSTSVLGEVNPWTKGPMLDDAADFHFAIVSDRTGGHRPGVFKASMSKVDLLSPAFVLSVGDLIEGYTENTARLDEEWGEIDRYVNDLDAPFFYTPGNHDMSNAVMAETWQRRYGPSYYYFVYKNVLFLSINSELFEMVGRPGERLPGPWTQAEQMTFIEKVLSEHSDVRWTIVLTHQPFWESERVHPDWLQVEELLGTRPYTVFAGHFHRYNKAVRNDRNFITLATTGGGSSLRGAFFGEFDQVAWVTMRADGPILANVDLDGVYDDQVATDASRALAAQLANSVRLEGVLDDQPIFDEGAAFVSIINPNDAAMQVVPVVSHTGNFLIDGLAPVSVPPGEERRLELSLSSGGDGGASASYGSLVPATISWTVTSEVDGAPVQFTNRTALMPLTTHQIPSFAQPPVIDGELSDWPGLKYSARYQGDVASPATDPDDISFAFSLGTDTEALYVAVEVTDDDLIIDANKLARDQDSVVVHIDPRDPELRNESMGIGQAVLGGTLAAGIMNIYTLATTPEDRLLPWMKDVAARTESAVVRTEHGYRLELKVPHAYINEKAGKTWDHARIAVRLYDLDEGDHAPLQFHWQPDRFGSAPLAGTHAFRRGGIEQ